MELTKEQAEEIYTILMEECGAVGGTISFRGTSHVRCESDGGAAFMIEITDGRASVHPDGLTRRRMDQVRTANKRIASLLTAEVPNVSCAQCHASTPDECARRHAAQLELCRAIESERAKMHREIDCVADRLVRAGNISDKDDTFVVLRSDVESTIAQREIVTAGLNIYDFSREMNRMIATWGK